MQAHWESLSTDAIPRAKRVERWNQYGSETLSNMTVDPVAGSEFVASISRISLGRIGMVSMTSTAASASSQGGTAGSWAADECDALMLFAPERGVSIFEQEGNRVELAPGSMAIRDLSRPWVHRCEAPTQFIMVKLPFSLFAKRGGNVEHIVEAGFCTSAPAVAMTMNVIRSARHTLMLDPEGSWHDEMSDLIFHSVMLLTAGLQEREQRELDAGNRLAIRREVMSFILSHLDDPDLSAGTVANALGLHMRTVQRAFYETGHTMRELILAQRLDRAARLLSGRARGGSSRAQSILDIAFSVGFNDVSHFSRSFSRRFGVTPRNYRGTSPVH